jgi:hypothetical protein
MPQTSEEIMNDSQVIIRFTSLIRPDVQGLLTGLVPYDNWQPENMGRIPIIDEWPDEIRDRLDYLKGLLDGRILWPPGGSEEAKRQTRQLVIDIVPTIEREIVAGVRLILTVGTFGDARRGELSGPETETLLDQYISSKTMALVRLLLAFRFTCPSNPEWQKRLGHIHTDPEWMRRFYHLHVNWGYDAIDGLPYVTHDRGDDVLYWVDADARQIGVISGGSQYRVYVPGTLDLGDSINPLARDQFLRYVAPQVVERLARSDSGGRTSRDGRVRLGVGTSRCVMSRSLS